MFGLFLLNPIVTGLLSFIGGILFTLITKLGEGRINEYYEKRKQRHDIKMRAAQDIISFCIEGTHKDFRIRAGSEQHIKFRAAEIAAIDTEVGVKLKKLIDVWSQRRNICKRNPFTADDELLAMEYKAEAEELSKQLLEIARRWGR